MIVARFVVCVVDSQPVSSELLRRLVDRVCWTLIACLTANGKKQRNGNVQLEIL